MHFSTSVAAALAVVGATAAPHKPAKDSVNPFLGKTYFVNPYYADELTQTIDAFIAKNDTLNAAKVRTVQKSIGTFVWVTTVSGLELLNDTIAAARKVQKSSGKEQIVELVLYNLPDRDCSGGESGGEFSSAKDGLNLYKHTFVDPYAAAVKAAKDLSFAIILEPDSLGNAVTNQNVPFCAGATPIYEEGIAYAIAQLQADNVHLYIDAAHGGWLGWDDGLPKAAEEYKKVVDLAQTFKNGSTIRGFATDVSNYNPFIASPRANYTEYSNSFDESHYASSLAPYLTNLTLPAHFIIDQGRSGYQNTRATWGEWCNVLAGFGTPPTTKTNNTYVDSLVWVKPGGESDGACGPTVNGEEAPKAGLWWDAYVQSLVKNANPPLKPTW